MKTGDALYAVAQPIAKGIDKVLGTNVQGCSGCKKMRENLNQGMSLQDAIYERWFKGKQQGDKMKYQITVVVEAEKTSEAILKAESIGEVISHQIKPEPQAQPPRNVFGGVRPPPGFTAAHQRG